jgi:hypothetical protein
MSGREIDDTERVPIDRWRRMGRIDAIRRRGKRIAVGAGVVFLGLTLVPAGENWSLLFGVGRLLSLVTGVSAWSVSEALDGDDDSVLAALGILVLVALAWSADRSRIGAIVSRALLGEVAASTAGVDTNGTAATAGADPTSRADDPGVTASAGDAASRPGGASLGVLATLLAGGAVALASLPQGGLGGSALGQFGLFVLLTAVVGGIVGLLAAVSFG